MGKKIVSIRLDSNVLNRLEVTAKNEKRTLSNLISKILSDFTDKN